MKTCHFTVVDDDQHTLYFVVRALAAGFPGSEVQKFSDGVEALDFLKSNRTDCLITDYSMVRMNGEELVRALRGAGVDIPALMISNSPKAQSAAESVGITLLDKGKITKELSRKVGALIGVRCMAGSV